MSSDLILFLVIVSLGVLFGIGFYFLARKQDANAAEEPVDPNLHGMIGSYADIRRAMVQSTPEDYSREEIPLTPENVVMLVRGFEGEVNNGGIDQFLFNSSGDYIQETVRALEEIQANRMAEILRIACKRFPGGNPPTNAFRRRAIMLAEVSPDGDAFHELDDQFYRYEDDLYHLLEKYKKDTKTQ